MSISFDKLLLELEQSYVEHMNELGLDLINPIHQCAAHAYTSSSHLFEFGKKSSVRNYAEKLDEIRDCANELSTLIKSIEPRYKNSLSNCLVYRHNLIISRASNINAPREGEHIVNFCDALSESAQSVKEVMLTPISDGYYNQFLFYFVQNVISPSKLFPSYYFAHYFYRKRKIEERQVLDFINHVWENHLYIEVRKTAIQIIEKKLNLSHSRRNAQKAVDMHLNSIFEDRAKYYAPIILRDYQRIKNYKKSLNKETSQ